MTAKNAKPTQRLITPFSKQPCWMIESLAAELHYSIPSIRRYLTTVGYYSSFTHNGKWYTLHSIPQFDRNGLWFSNDIGFSRVGSLTNTLIHLITRSPSGITAEQLGKKLRCRCHSVLVHLCRRGQLQREKQGRSYIYMAADSRTAVVQRQALTIENSSIYQLPAEIAVLVLVEFILNPELSFVQLAETIKRNKGVTVAVVQIERLFEQHTLKKMMQIGVPRLGMH